MSEPIYCGLAFGAFSKQIYGNYVPCCGIDNTMCPTVINNSSHTVIEKINTAFLRSIRRELNNGVFPPPCHLCKKSEDVGSESMRTIWNKTLINKPPNEIVEARDISYIDISLGSKCNSKCMTCNYSSSTFWIDEHKAIWPDDPINIMSEDFTVQDCDTLLDSFPNVSRLSFIGGEPTIIDEHLILLKKLVESGKSKNMCLTYVTNLTGISDELIFYWKQFKEIIVSVSVDGVGKVNEYMRYPIKWDKVEGNLNKYLELVKASKEWGGTLFSINLSCTVSMLNFIDSIDMLIFWVRLLQRHSHDAQDVMDSGCFLNRVTYPEYLNFTLLPTEFRSIILNKIELFTEEISNLKVHSSVPSAVNLLKNWIQEPQLHDKELVEKAIYFINGSDKFRNRSINDYLPDVWEKLNEQIK